MIDWDHGVNVQEETVIQIGGDCLHLSLSNLARAWPSARFPGMLVRRPPLLPHLSLQVPAKPNSIAPRRLLETRTPGVSVGSACRTCPGQNRKPGGSHRDGMRTFKNPWEKTVAECNRRKMSGRGSSAIVKREFSCGMRFSLHYLPLQQKVCGRADPRQNCPAAAPALTPCPAIPFTSYNLIRDHKSL